MKRKVKALAIAPYESMKNTLISIAATHNDIELTVFVGDLDEGVEIVRNHSVIDYDVIISRGGTAELLEKAVNIPIIEITFSIYDILSAIKLTENPTFPYAIVGFPSITKNARLLCDILQYKVEIQTIHSMDEARVQLDSLKQRGYRMILCDMITNTIAKSIGLSAILITSGRESLENTLDQAVKLCNNFGKTKDENRLLASLLKGQENDIVVYNGKKTLCFSTIKFDEHSPIFPILEKEIPLVQKAGERKVIKSSDNRLVSVTGRIERLDQEVLTVFCVSIHKVPVISSKYGIKYLSNVEAADSFFYDFYNMANASGNIQKAIEQFSQTNFPIVVFGEEGAGMEGMARTIYTQSRLNNNPLIIIDCGAITDKGWKFLTNHYNSPLMDTDNTIFFKEMGDLPEEKFKQLYSQIVDINLHKHNRLIFSYTYSPEDAMPDSSKLIMNQFSCLTLKLPPLRNNMEEISDLASLYINSLNLSLGKQIIGFEPEAMDIIRQYHWPYNLSQFKRILNELVTITDSLYISAKDVSELLKKENSNYLNSEKSICNIADLDLNRTLEEINKDIISRVIYEENGNQSAAAKRLGIGRTTLWRMLK